MFITKTSNRTFIEYIYQTMCHVKRQNCSLSDEFSRTTIHFENVQKRTRKSVTETERRGAFKILKRLFASKILITSWYVVCECVRGRDLSQEN